MEKNLNYKVVDLIESYNFHIKFISIQVQTKNYKFLKRGWTLPPCPAARLLPPWGTAVGPCRRLPRVRCIVLQIFSQTIYFCKIYVKQNVKKEKILDFVTAMVADMRAIGRRSMVVL
jgi:hypothetical protein